MNNIYTKKCGSGMCRACPYMEECDFFSSNSTGQRYRPKNSNGGFLDCRSENIVYLIFCRVCHFQYVGETVNCLQTRFSQHKSNINSARLFISILRIVGMVWLIVGFYQ